MLRNSGLRAARCAALVLAAALAACTSLSRLSADAPPSVDLTGSWKIDPAHSTDSGKALQDLMKRASRARRSGSAGAGAGGFAGRGPRGGGPGGGGPEGSGDDALLTGPGEEAPAPDIALQRSLLAGGDWLKIEQRPGEMVITNADHSRSFVPGERSVVSVPSGVADQKSGWKGKEYWIELKPQVGPSASEKLRLSPDGKQLIQTIQVGSDGRIPRLEVTRVYLPTQDIPTSVPSVD